MTKLGKNSIIFNNAYYYNGGTAAGPFEAEGPYGKYFDKLYKDNYCDVHSWEQAEIKLLETAYQETLKKVNLSDQDIELMVGGDLNNQIAINNYMARHHKISHLGVFSACATCVESLLIASTFIDDSGYKYICAMASSHNATSERQYRYPTEYGGQKPESLTFTATGAGCGIVTSQKTNIKIIGGTIGMIYDAGLTDPQDMGRAMAPAAAQTLKQHLEDFGREPEYYDLIITGDLSTYGSNVFEQILKKQGITLNNYNDCGKMIYDINNQEVFAGGSGCGCVTLMTFGYFLPELMKGNLNRVLIIATGALHNPIMIAQKESIPCVAHAIVLEREVI